MRTDVQDEVNSHFSQFCESAISHILCGFFLVSLFITYFTPKIHTVSSDVFSNLRSLTSFVDLFSFHYLSHVLLQKNCVFYRRVEMALLD